MLLMQIPVPDTATPYAKALPDPKALVLVGDSRNIGEGRFEKAAHAGALQISGDVIF